MAIENMTLLAIKNVTLSERAAEGAELLERGLSGVELVIADEHAGLAAAVRRFLPEVRRQRCTVHLQRNVLAKVPHRLRKRVARGCRRLPGPRAR